MKSKSQQNFARINKVPKQVSIKVHSLQQYISLIFSNCSMPPLNEFLQLEGIQENQFRVKLYDFQKCLLNEEERYNYVYFLERGKVILKKTNQDFSMDSNSEGLAGSPTPSRIVSSKFAENQFNNHDKAIQIKENNFFLFVNPKKINEIQHYSISSYENGQCTKCLIGRIKINPQYNIFWYIQESQKYQFLAPFFQSEDFLISQHKLKGLCRFFHSQNFKRGSVLTYEGHNNQKLYIVRSGECQFSKSFSYDQKNHSNSKVLKVANGGSKAVFGSQFLLYEFMGASKPVSVATRAMIDLQLKYEKLKLKINDRSVNNFTVSVLSGYAEIYFISVAKFKELCEKYVPEAPQQLRKNVEANYITLLRTTKQKLQLQLLKIERDQKKSYEQRVLIEAKMESGNFEHSPSPDLYQSESPIRLRRSEFIETNLQDSEVQKIRSKRLEKKIELILEAKKKQTNYKKKIQIVLKEKLNTVRTFESPILKETPKEEDQELGLQASQIKKDLQSIFMNNQSNYRTNSINRQNQILAKKQMLLKKRYASVDNMLIVHQDQYDRHKNKLLRMDLLQRGVKDLNEDKIKLVQQPATQDFSARIKKSCIEKINKANKIKQQFMIIRSECENCHCYDDIESYMSTGRSQKDLKQQAAMTGWAWRTSYEQKKNINQEPLQKLHSRTKLISQKASRKYHHNLHLHEKKRRFVSGSQKRLSAPLI